MAVYLPKALITVPEAIWEVNWAANAIIPMGNAHISARISVKAIPACHIIF